jgi:hypothetical protein
MRIWLQVLFYSGIGCLAMVLKDLTSTIYTDAVANGRAKLAGNMDGIGDYVNIILASFSGVQLIHLGWRGWVGIIPIGIVGKYTTQHAVKWSAKNIKENVVLENDPHKQ